MEEGYVQCPFCDEQLVKNEHVMRVVESCCNEPNIQINDKMIVCINCGSVQGYEYANEYIDFHDNKYKMRRKSVYIRKYHILNVINDITQKNNIQIGNNREKILRIFALINKVLPQVNGDSRKRMISIKFILRQIFRILGMEYKFIPLLKSKKTLIFYKLWWKQVYELIKDDVAEIINK